MRKLLLFIILTLNYTIGFSQNQNERVLYIVDSIPVIEEPAEGFGTLSENEIDRIDVVKNREVINSTGHIEFDALIYVFTKEYVNRPDSIKTIPTTKQMIRKNGQWYLKNSTSAYTGKFIDYYLIGKIQGEGVMLNGKLEGKRLRYHPNGNVSDINEYENGISNGMEERFYEDGTLMQKGRLINGKEIGVWEMYHPNGKLKQRTTFNENGKMDGESISYYSTGELRGKITYKNGIYQKDKDTNKTYDLYNQAQVFYKQGNFKSAIKKYSKCLEIKPNWVDGYFARATAKLNNMEFEEAIADFDKTLDIEPYFVKAYANKAFARIRKYELGNGRTLSQNKNIQVVASKTTVIPESELKKICEDLSKAISLGDNNWMVLEAVKKYCAK
ncbi:tetratricopeptide repeat protein [Marinifilum sp. D737]|uniref:tetratricopeptide repeat protein n=1 Tax=Marinifilum sp. D737 TaxID=2969628 RepID=UPI0022768175|nr:tetratricopeptide repeat protein [Marinifilum sp. D737]MCY1634033.1 tetratricopeptide repeat protein [Marinifilum sp. D737]